jgi:hypothetical protein
MPRKDVKAIARIILRAVVETWMSIAGQLKDVVKQ